MCLICIELEKNKLTIAEAMQNVDEMRSGLGGHANDVDVLILEHAFKEMDKLLKDPEPFVGPPPLIAQDVYIDDEPLELDLDDIPTTSW